MHRTSLSLAAALASVLLLGLFLPLNLTSAGQRMGIATKVGVPRPHVQEDSQFRWWQCYACHTARNIHTNQVKPSGPTEPCVQCHLQPTARERQFVRTCKGAGCPVLLNYRQPDGSELSFYFGDRP